MSIINPIPMYTESCVCGCYPVFTVNKKRKGWIAKCKCGKSSFGYNIDDVVAAWNDAIQKETIDKRIKLVSQNP